MDAPALHTTIDYNTCYKYYNIIINVARLSTMEGFTTTQVKEYLLEKEIPEDVADNFFNNMICGQAFLKLNEDDVKELAPLIGIRTKIRGIIKEHQKVLATIV